MKKAILGKKLGMTQVFMEDGTLLPVTVIEAGPCDVVQKKTTDTDGYDAVQVSFGEIRERLVNRPMKGHYAKAKTTPKRHLREFKLEDAENYEVGQAIKADIFEAGEHVDVSGISKGKGFAGNIKRHNAARSRMSHGGGPVHRSPGSMGAAASPSRVFKHKKLPGHMGHEHITVQNLEIIRVDAERNFLLVRGAVPGPKGGILAVKETTKANK